MPDSFTPPEAVRNAARRGLDLRQKWGRGGLSTAEAGEAGIGSGVARARDLANGRAISLETIGRMVAFFARHERNYQPDKKEADGGPTAGTIAWLLWGGNPGRDWANRIRSENKMEKATRDELKAAAETRSKKYGIAVLEGGSLTIPARFAEMGATEADFADPVNYSYPVWLTHSRESLTPEMLGQIRNAPARFAQFADNYDSRSRAVVAGRIEDALKKFKVGEYARKADEIRVFKADNERQILYGVVLRPDYTDSQNDIVSGLEVERAAHGWMAKSRRLDWQHQELLNEQDAVPVESYIAPVDFAIGEDTIKKGDWIVAVHIPGKTNWQAIKAGKLAMAFSITGLARRVQSTT